MSDRPSGTVTFLFTDIEGSTKLWQDQPEAMMVALERHDLLLRSVIESHSGFVFKTVGDAFCAAFQTAGDALQASVELQLRVTSESWSDEAIIKVRAALHTGAVESRDDDYFGVTLSRVGRILSAGHGGQILLSHTTQDLVQDLLPDDTALRPMGTHRLRDLSRPEDVFQLEHKDLEGEFPALKTLDNLPNNLPRQLTSFIGRETEISKLRTLFQTTRLLTLTGVGGTGKTRLSLRFAEETLAKFPGGVWFVELAPISDPDQVTAEIALMLSINPGDSPMDSIASGIGERSMLIVVDNCEHLLDSVSRVVESLLKRCPNLKILATGREGLGIDGETLYQVPSLAVPEPNAATLDSVGEYEGVTLFVDRITARKNDFTLDQENLQTVVSICKRLDGIPLALELAAAKVHSMPVEQISERLDNRFRLLTGGSRTAFPRQQTLRALIDWSFDLLEEHEKSLFLRLSVFSDGWTLVLAEGVCSGEGIDEYEVAEILSQLVQKSLVNLDSDRYSMLETIRQYATDRLVESSEAGLWRDRHLEFLADYCEALNPGTNTNVDPIDFGSIMIREFENFTSAYHWSLSREETIHTGVRILISTHWTFQLKCRLQEGLHFCQMFLKKYAATDSPLILARLTLAQAESLRLLGRIDEAQVFINRARTMFESIGDPEWLSDCNFKEGGIYWFQKDFDKGLKKFESCLELIDEVDHPFRHANVVHRLAHMHQGLGNLDLALELQLDSLSRFQTIKARLRTGMSHADLGELYRERGDMESSTHHLFKAVEIVIDAKVPIGLLGLTEQFACTFSAQGLHKEAAALFFAWDNFIEQMALDKKLQTSTDHDERRTATFAALSAEETADSKLIGKQMTLKSAIAFAKQNSTSMKS